MHTPAALPEQRQSTRIKQIAEALDQPRMINIALLLIMVVAALFRFYGLNWDEGQHLHPDERFLSTVTNDLQWPENFDNYFNPAISSLSPYSLPDMGLYVYGTLPVYVVKWAAILIDYNNYDKITFVGRAFSALFDIATIYFLFLIGKRLYSQKVGLLAAFLMSLSVLNIQLSHFYAVDTFANLFVVGTIYSVLRANDTGRWLDHAMTGLLFGLGLASKLNVIILIVPILIGAGINLYQRARSGNLQSALEHTLVRLFTVFFLAALTFRIIHPISFSGPSFWNWSLNTSWVEDIKDQQKTLNGEADLPWIQQWTNRSLLFPLSNIVLWGLGVPLGLASLAGIGLAVYELIRYRKLEHLLPLAYVGLTFFYHAILFVKFMRYFLPIYPFLILFAAYAVLWFWRYANTPAEPAAETVEAEASPKWWDRIGHRIPLRANRPLAVSVAGFVVIGTLIYALAFSSIYSRPNSRIQASRWMYQNLPQGSVLANEHWDDWLPIGGVDGFTSYGDQGMFKAVEMRNYEADHPDKLNWMVENLTQANYIILSSNRLYDSIPRLPLRYPLTSRYYQLLFSGELGFERIKEFTSYPTFLGISIPDQSAEESFSVYDHPRVQIFQKTAAFDPQLVRQRLSMGIAWESVVHLTPREASTTFKSLELSGEEEGLYQQVATWSNAAVNEGSWGNRIPVLAWFIVFLFIGLLAFPLTFFIFQPFADRGYVFSKAIGLLLVGWGAWVIASLRLAPFTWWTILAVMVLLVLSSALLIPKQRWTELLAFARAHWQLLLFEEVLFWLFFAFLFVIRLSNPDLWHPGLGGEKPMDLAYLTAIVRTPYFPAYDPWFSGGYINYYYFGFVLAAVIIHLTGIVPTVAYNLAVPTFFALTAMGAFSVVFNFAERPEIEEREKVKRWLGVGRTALIAGLAGALFVAVIGNLAQVKLLWDSVRNLSSIQPIDNAPILVTVKQFVDGLNQYISGRELSIPREWWYWNATRVIPPASGEAGPINELPFFTFLFGDLHAHMMALPYTLLALGLALNLIRATQQRNLSNELPWWRNPVEIGTLGLVGLTIGALWPMNTWDFPTYSALTIAALVCVEYARRGRIDIAGLWAVSWRTLFIVVIGRLLFLPFHQNYASAYFGAELWKGSRTPLWAYLLIHGFFLFILTSYLVVELLKGQGHNALVRWLQLQLRRFRRRARMQRLVNALVHPASSFRLLLDFSQLMFAVIVVTFVINQVLGLFLALTFLSAMLLFSTRPDPLRQFTLCMIGLGLVFTALVEVVVLKGDISRMNTVFKFYLQVWVLWAVASAAVLPWLAEKLRATPRQRTASLAEPAQVQKPAPGPSIRLAQSWWWAFGLLLAACFLYPMTATPQRIRDRFENSASTTIDGTAYMETSVYYDEGRPVPLNWDQQAVDWLKQHVIGIPTILEANTPLYRWGSRISIYTGLPTVIGWDWHQKQQRSILDGQIIDRRIEDVRTIYNSPDPVQAATLLSYYNVKYIYVGPLEQLYYDPNGLAKFDQPSDLWSLIYQNDQVKIYQVH
jgi:YYY domain-containing protein